MGLSCLQSSGAIQRVGGLRDTPQCLVSSQHHFRSKCWLLVYWKYGGNDAMCTSLRKTLDISEQDDYASLKCQCGRHIRTPCVCGDINKSARGCDVICVTDPMLITGELQQERCTHSRSHTLKHTDQNKHAQSCVPVEVRLTTPWWHRRPKCLEKKDEIWSKVGWEFLRSRVKCN